MREYILWLAKFITIVILIFIVPLAIAGIVAAGGAMHEEGGNDSRYAVAVVQLNGVIEDSSDIVRELYKKAHDDSVKAIVLRIDSPGGAVAPSQDIYDAVMHLKARKPIVASMGSVAASGGFYAAIGATKIFAQPGTLTGSIGVIMQIPNFTKLADRVGVDVVTIKSGTLKDAGNSFRSMTEPERQYLENTAHRVHEDFMAAVVAGRGIKLDVVRTFANGRIIVGTEAKELGLVDEFGGVYEAARSALTLAKIELGADELPKLIYSEDKFSELRELLRGAINLPALFAGRGAIEMRYQMY